MSWTQTRTLLNSMIFDLGYREVARRTMLNAATIYRLANGDCQPQPRTQRDVEAIIELWLDDSFSRMQHAIASGEDDSQR